jgi:hypothetical protein
MSSLACNLLCIFLFIHPIHAYGIEKGSIVVEFVAVKEENLQEQQPEEDEQVLEWLWSTFVIPLTSVKASPGAF